MRILQCMASVDPRKGGPSTAVRAMSASLVQQGHHVTIVAHGDSASTSHEESVDGYRLLRFPLTWRAWQYSRDYHRWLAQNIERFDLVVITSLFLAHTYFASRLARRHGIPYVIRPHGLLNSADLRRRRYLLKRVYLRLIDAPALHAAEFVFCTSEAEAQQAVSPGRCVRVIPLGVDVPSASFARSPETVDRDLVVFVGRVTEKKGVDLLLRSLAQVRAARPQARLLIAGPDSDNLMSRYLHEIPDRDDMAIEYVDYVTPAERDLIFEKAGVFVLPSQDENFGIAVAEAMAASVPVVVTEGVSHAPLVRHYEAGVITTRDPAAIAESILHVMTLDEFDYHSLESGASRLVASEFSWEKTTRLLTQFVGLGASSGNSKHGRRAG